MPVAAIGMLLFVVGCRSYEPAPIDWNGQSAAWTKPGTLNFSNLTDVATLAIVGNPALNRLRIERDSADKAANAAGWWEDPELDIDLMRIVNPADNPYLGGASLSFSIPLSGVPALERKAAAAYMQKVTIMFIEIMHIQEGL